MSNLIDRDTVEELLRKAVDDYGKDYIDPNHLMGCQNVFYSKGKKRYCIAAYVLRNLGVGDSLLRKFNRDRVDTVIYALEQYSEMRFSPGARRLLIHAQQEQDAGHNWGSALGVATDRVSEE